MKVVIFILFSIIVVSCSQKEENITDSSADKYQERTIYIDTIEVIGDIGYFSPALSPYGGNGGLQAGYIINNIELHNNIHIDTNKFIYLEGNLDSIDLFHRHSVNGDIYSVKFGDNEYYRIKAKKIAKE